MNEHKIKYKRSIFEIIDFMISQNSLYHLERTRRPIGWWPGTTRVLVFAEGPGACIALKGPSVIPLEVEARTTLTAPDL